MKHPNWVSTKPAAGHEQTLERQIKLGVVPAGTKLAPKPDFIKD